MDHDSTLVVDWPTDIAISRDMMSMARNFDWKLFYLKIALELGLRLWFMFWQHEFIESLSWWLKNKNVHQNCKLHSQKKQLDIWLELKADQNLE